MRKYRSFTVRNFYSTLDVQALIGHLRQGWRIYATFKSADGTEVILTRLHIPLVSRFFRKVVGDGVVKGIAVKTR